jgi:hypothetical protein
MTKRSERPPDGMFDPEAFQKLVEQYVRENIQEAVPGTRCVDGRYESGSEGKVSFAGGDLGIVMALVALNRLEDLGLSAEECFDQVYNTVSEEGTFCMHTDDHTHGEDKIGCGHASKASSAETSASYISFMSQDPGGVPQEVLDAFLQDMQNLVSYANKEAVSRKKIENVVLVGPHGEMGVLVVDSKDYTVRHQSAGGEQFFVYDKGRTEHYIDEIWSKLSVKLASEKGVTLTEDHKREFIEIFSGQTNATLHHLAKGQPIGGVEILDGGEVKVEFLNIIE